MSLLLLGGCVALLAYVWVGYPVLVALLARRTPAPPPVRLDDATAPTVTVLLVAADEAERIEARIANLLAQDYPRARLELLVGCDGSRDGTVERARRCAGARVRVVAFERRRGKPAVLCDLVEQARGEVLVLCDARQRFAPDAVRMLVARLVAEPGVGAVSGELALGDAQGSGAAVGAYWRYEKWIRKSESRLDSTVGVTGAIYALWRPLFERFPADTLLDDVLVPMRVVQRGLRVVLEPRALAFDRPASDASREYRRKVRTLAGNFQLFVRERWLLSPLQNRVWMQTLSHKALRLTTPFAMAGALAAGVAAFATHPWALLVQLPFYVTAAIGLLAQRTGVRVPLVALPYTLCVLSLATLVGLLRFVRGSQAVTWERAG